MSISTKEELQYLLHRSWEIEKKFESIPIWRGFTTIGFSHRKLLLTLARDSQKHRLDLEMMLRKLGLAAPTTEIGDSQFDFDGMKDAEILQKIRAHDEMIAALYTEILEKTNTKFVATLGNDDDINFFINTLKSLIQDEKRHVNLINAVVGNIIRIL